MDNVDKPNLPSAGEMQKEIRSLKRKLALAEANLTRAKIIAEAQERTEVILNTALKKEIQFFKLVLENTTNILLLFDFDGCFAYASDTFLKNADIANFGLISGQYFQEVLAPIISEEILNRFVKAVNCAVDQKSTAQLEETIDFNFKGMPRTFSILITPMTDEHDKSTGIMALFNDISEINKALETANRANLAKSDFLANMSHEIRTPLNAIIGMTAIARKSPDMEKIHYCLDRINDSSTHLLGVINDILDMSKIESNHFELSFSSFAFEKMLLRVIDMIRFKIEDKHISFSLYCDSSIPYAIVSDEQRLAQVIMNLLSNAVKFTPKNGSIAIRAEVDRFEGADYTLRISIRDSGIGIPEEQRPRIFKVFSQADSSISRKFGGTGLGLAISKNIINALGGDIWFDSPKGKGTIFTFTLKTRACQLNPDARLNDHVRILVVDNMPDVLLNFSLYAKRLGVSCTTVKTVEGALAILREQPHDIIFADWHLPNTSNISFARQLNRSENPPMMVTMLSSSHWPAVEKEAKEAGINTFISKPILLPVIENVLDRYSKTLNNTDNDAPDDFSGKTILLVDDIEINREIIISVLEPSGISIVCAENGREAVDAFMTNPGTFDLIFMDVQMPEMDGYEATRRIRTSGLRTARKIPIVAMTANVFKEDIERCRTFGMDDHIGKPINVTEVWAKIREWTGK